MAWYRYILTEQVCFSYEQVEIEKRKESGSHLKLLDSIRKDMNSGNLLDLKLHILEGNISLDFLEISFISDRMPPAEFSGRFWEPDIQSI